MAVMIGIDPHKGSHTAVAVTAAEEPLGKVRVRACPAQAEQLVAWAAAWPERTWAVEGAPGLGRLLAQQLVAAGERVLDVQPKLAARVRLLQTGNTGKSDPNDALSVAVAALRSTAQRPVLADDHATVLKVWAKGHRDLSRPATRSPAGCTPCSATWCPAGSRDEITAGYATRILGRITPAARPPRRAGTSLPSCWLTSATWTPSGATSKRSWPPRSRHPAPASPRSSAPARSSPPP
jgi:transposase